MPTVSPFKPRNTWRIDYTITLFNKKKRKTKYAKTRAEANALSSQLSRIEEGTRTGLATQRDIETWIGRNWLSDEEAQQAFIGYSESAQRAQLVRTSQTDYQRILAAYGLYLEDNIKAGVRQKNYRAAMGLAAQVIRWLEEEVSHVPDLTVAQVQAYRTHLRNQGYAPWTVFHHLTTLRILLDQAIDLGMIHKNPARQVSLKQPKKVEERRILNAEEIAWILDTSLHHRQWIHGSLPTMTRLGLYAGLRNQEMSWLKWDCIDWDRRVITIKESTCEITGEVWTPKDHELRRLDIKASCMDYLKAEKRRQKKEDLLSPFVMPGGGRRRPGFREKPLSQDALQKALLKMLAAESKKDSGITVSSLRHTYATMALRSGIDLRTLQQRMGHSDIKVTMDYLHYIEPEEHPMDKLPY